MSPPFSLALATRDLPRLGLGLALGQGLLVLVQTGVVALALQVTGTDARLEVGQFLTLFLAVGVDLRLAVLSVALRPFRRDGPSALIVLAGIGFLVSHFSFFLLFVFLFF